MQAFDNTMLDCAHTYTSGHIHSYTPSILCMRVRVPRVGSTSLSRWLHQYLAYDRPVVLQVVPVFRGTECM